MVYLNIAPSSCANINVYTTVSNIGEASLVTASFKRIAGIGGILIPANYIAGDFVYGIGTAKKSGKCYKIGKNG